MRKSFGFSPSLWRRASCWLERLTSCWWNNSQSPVKSRDGELWHTHFVFSEAHWERVHRWFLVSRHSILSSCLGVLLEKNNSWCLNPFGCPLSLGAAAVFVCVSLFCCKGLQLQLKWNNMLKRHSSNSYCGLVPLASGHCEYRKLTV